MALRRIIQRWKGAIGADGGMYIGNSIWVISVSGAPTNGTSGTGAGFAGPGSIACSTSGNHYRNSGTKASPTWTAM